jgi:hypothetical protein
MTNGDNLLLARELKQAIDRMVLDNDQILYNADLMFGIKSKEVENMRKTFSKDESDLMMLRQIMIIDTNGKNKMVIRGILKNLNPNVKDYVPVSIFQHYEN